MALSNDMSRLLNKIERRLGLLPLLPHLPENLQKDKWADIIMEDTIVTFSRYFPYSFPLVISEETCDKRMEDNVMWYYIKDEILDGCKLLGLKDIDWTDNTLNNASLSAGALGGGLYLAGMACPISTFESVAALQMTADFASLYNRAIYIDFRYPNKFAIKGFGNTNFDLNRFKVILLVEHRSLSTISPTMQEIFEQLAICDIANFLYMNLRYYDNLNTAFVEIDLKLQELNSISDKRESVIEDIKNSYVSAASDTAPYIWSV